MAGCRKRRYRDRIAAELALATSGKRRHARRDADEVRAYRCEICPGGPWHLTSMSLEELARAAETRGGEE